MNLKPVAVTCKVAAAAILFALWTQVGWKVGAAAAVAVLVTVIGVLASLWEADRQ